MRRQEDALLLEVEHDGTISPEDQKRLAALLSGTPEPAAGGKVGLRNVRERLALLYGDRAALSIRQNAGGSILACIRLPLERR